MHNVCVGEMKTQIIRDWRNKFIIIMRENDYNGDEMLYHAQIIREFYNSNNEKKNDYNGDEMLYHGSIVGNRVDGITVL